MGPYCGGLAEWIIVIGRYIRVSKHERIIVYLGPPILGNYQICLLSSVTAMQPKTSLSWSGASF